MCAFVYILCLCVQKKHEFSLIVRISCKYISMYIYRFFVLLFFLLSTFLSPRAQLFLPSFDTFDRSMTIPYLSRKSSVIFVFISFFLTLFVFWFVHDSGSQYIYFFFGLFAAERDKRKCCRTWTKSTTARSGRSVALSFSPSLSLVPSRSLFSPLVVQQCERENHGTTRTDDDDHDDDDDNGDGEDDERRRCERTHTTLTHTRVSTHTHTITKLCKNGPFGSGPDAV